MMKKKSDSFDLSKYISTIIDAVSLLSTSFHTEAIQYLSDNLIEFIKSYTFQQIDEKIIFEIIDNYIVESKKNPKSEIECEYKKVFNLLNEINERLLLIHMLLHTDEEFLNSDMIKYIINNIDD